jgi:hypothetical protein
MCIDYHSMGENLRKVERPTDNKRSGGSAIQPGGNGNASSHARSVTNLNERLDERIGGIAIIGEINVG